MLESSHHFHGHRRPSPHLETAGEADALVADRVWKETETALAGSNSRVYFETLRECGALSVIYPEVEALFGVPQPEKWHPEIDTDQILMVNFNEFADSSLNFFVYTFTKTTRWAYFHEVKHDVLLKISQIG
mgnify:CR=1 FL=1